MAKKMDLLGRNVEFSCNIAVGLAGCQPCQQNSEPLVAGYGPAARALGPTQLKMINDRSQKLVELVENRHGHAKISDPIAHFNVGVLHPKAAPSTPNSKFPKACGHRRVGK